MDLTVYPKSRIARLPRPLQKPAALARNLVRRRGKPEFVWESDGLATMYASPFLDDEEWDELYWRVEADWFPNWHADIRWRVWLLTRLARQAKALPGNFAEFGVFRGGTAYMTLDNTEPHPGDRRFFLFDTFEGTPSDELTSTETAEGLGEGQYAGTSVEYVTDLLDRWSDRIEIREGDVAKTLGETETGPLAFVHLDMNASAPTAIALEYVYPRLVAGGIVVFDDYGDPHYRDQRAVIEGFFAGLPEEAIALPSGQAFAIRTGS